MKRKLKIVVKTTLVLTLFTTLNCIVTLQFKMDNNVSALELASSQIKPPLTCIDSPKIGSTLNGDVFVSGWALNQSSVKEVKIYVDGVFNGYATIGGTRLDVNNAYPGYPGGDTSGFRYTISTKPIQPGSHTITAEQVGLDGTKQSANTNFKLLKKEPLACIDYPKNGSNLSGNILISGWALNDSAVKEVKIYFDGIYKGNATIGYSRPDVNIAYPGYPGGDKSGYRFTLDTSNLLSGSHSITAESIGIDGTKKSNSTTINLFKEKPMSSIDNPKNGSILNNSNIELRGWALNPSGIKTIKVYLNGVLKGYANYGGVRQDVFNAYSYYSNSMNSGFSYVIETNNLSPGSYKIDVEFLGNDGSVESKTLQIELDKPQPKISIDAPILNSTAFTDKILIGGWAINASGINNVKVYLDNVYVGNAQIGGTRQDVASVFSNYKDSLTSGFNYILNTNGITIGMHQISVQAFGNDGTFITSKSSFNLLGIVNYQNYYNSLDYYVDRQFTLGANANWDNTAVTRDDVKYYMDKNNFLNDTYGKYMFLKLNYVSGISVDNLNKALSNQGILNNEGQAFDNAGKQYNVNPIYLVSHSLLETGNGTSSLANGILVTQVDGVSVAPRFVYNMYGIGAKDEDPIRLGSEYAYKQGWFTPEDAIIGGAKFIASDYITSTQYNQNTLYKMKWNYDVIWHEYATDIGWAYKQTYRIKSLIDKMTSPVLYFEVPKFN